MRMPHLEFIYRIVVSMDPTSSLIPNIHNNGSSRLILPIAGGTVRGPLVNGEIVQNSGSDWAQIIGGSSQVTNACRSPRISPVIAPASAHT